MRATGALSLALTCIAPAASSAQVIHVPTAYRRVLPPDTKVLTVTALAGTKESPNPYQKAQLLLDDDRIVVQKSEGGILIIELANRDIRDVMNQLVNDMEKRVHVESDYPLYPASYLGRHDRQPLDTPFVVMANADDPDLRIGFGVVMSLANPEGDDGGGVLTQTGFQLDVVGSHQIVGPRRRAPWYRPQLYAQVRLGLNADQQIQVGEVEQDADPTAPQFEDALRQADQIAASGQLDVVFPVNDRFDWVVTPSYAVSWTRPNAIPLPDVRVGSELKPAADVFSAAAITRTLSEHRRTFPLSEVGGLVTAQFRRRNVPAFYAGGGFMWREILVRGVRYRREPPAAGSPPGTPLGNPIPTSLQGIMRTDGLNVWRAALGARLAGVLDVRLDASGPFRRNEAEPLLRLLVSRAFPILQ